jgi:hypothetical protein
MFLLHKQQEEMLGKGQLSECYSTECSKGKLMCARNWSSVGRGSYFNAHNFQTIGFQPTSYPKETCASQLVMSPVQRGG